MEFTKPALTLEQQVDLLRSRGMEGDAAEMAKRLAFVNYYRLSGYWYPFRNPDDTFREGTTFETVWDRYVFDRELRVLVMDAVERIEIAVRTQLTLHHAHMFGAFGYANEPKAVPKMKPDEREEWLKGVRAEVERNKKESFVTHFRAKYGDQHSDLPIWAATELMTFGSILKLAQASPRPVKKSLATSFEMPDKIFGSWLVALNTLRNICAHHARLWNHPIGTKPMIPPSDGYPVWHAPIPIENERVFVMLTICNHCLHCIAPDSYWAVRVRKLLEAHPAIPKRDMGFPDRWLESPLWADASESELQSVGSGEAGEGLVRDAVEGVATDPASEEPGDD